MAPVIHQLHVAQENGLAHRVCVTAQHRSMLDEVLRVFDIRPDYDLDIMRANQTLSGISSAVLRELDLVLSDFEPHWVLVQGDTTTAMAAALAAFHRRIAVGHVEAGLRTGDLNNPWPEEANRRMTAVLATRHYCPTEGARAHLLREGVSDEAIRVTGNTVVDVLQMVSGLIDRDKALQARLRARFDWLDDKRKLILVTGHRRESFGEGFRQICHALAMLAERDDVQIVYPVHLNPNVQEPVARTLGNSQAIRLLEPLDYVSFVWLMQRCFFILTDSGGIQEEAPTFRKPVLVMRNVTERPEAMQAGTSRLVGAQADRIVAESVRLLEGEAHFRAMCATHNPFGDGTAAIQIVNDLAQQRRLCSPENENTP